MTKKNPRPKIVLVNRCIIKNKEGKILLIKRSSQDSREAGKWEIPGGKLELGQDPTHAIETEVLEETGLYVKVIGPKFFVEIQALTTGKYKGLPFITIVGEATLIGGEIRLSEEHEDFKWASSNEVKNLETTEITQKTLASIDY